MKVGITAIKPARRGYRSRPDPTHKTVRSSDLVEGMILECGSATFVEADPQAVAGPTVIVQTTAMPAKNAGSPGVFRIDTRSQKIEFVLATFGQD